MALPIPCTKLIPSHRSISFPNTAHTFSCSNPSRQYLPKHNHSSLLHNNKSSVMAKAQVEQQLSQGIADFYDESSSLWEDMWGEHMHHGFYDSSSSSSVDNKQAQIRMIEESLSFAKIPDVDGKKPKKILDVGCGIGGSSRYLARKYGARVNGITLSPIQVDRATSLASKQGLADQVTEPLVRVLCLVDSDRLSMPYVYEGMERAKESIKRHYEADASKYQPIWDIIDSRWDRTLHKPIHGAAHFLNPQLFFEAGYNADDLEVYGNVKTCIEKMVPDFDRRIKLRQELATYKADTIAWSDDAKSSRFMLRPDVWWDQYGACLPNMMMFARRILVQPTSASACERNWSMFNHTQARKRHLLHSRRLNNLVFVNSNLLLQERQQCGDVGEVVCLEKLSLLPPTMDAVDDDDDDDDDEAVASASHAPVGITDLCDEDEDEDEDDGDDEDWA